MIGSLDVIVLDWMSWPEGQWGQKTFDPGRFPDPDAMTRRLHDEGVRFMMSIWPNVNGNGPDQRELRAAGHLLGLTREIVAGSSIGGAGIGQVGVTRPS